MHFLFFSNRIMPESVRWLVSQNRTEEAIEILKQVAKTNKKELPDERLDFIRNRVSSFVVRVFFHSY